ncbi:MAG: hypothetical protein R3F36_14975 [Candidatus Competibacteraceae bacterium]
MTQFHDDEGLDNALDLFIDWSTLKPVDQKDRLKKPLRIQQDYFGRIEEVPRTPLIAVIPPIRSFGTVEDLWRDGEDGQAIRQK